MTPLKEARKRNGLTLDRVASAAGVTKGGASLIERAARDTRVSTLYRVAVAAGDTQLADALRPYVVTT